MANMFEKPIAAKPMSEFTALPLQFIDAAIQRRQKQYDTAKVTMDEMEDKIMGTKALTGDTVRHQALLKDIQGKIDTLAESADGDYSQIAVGVDALTRDIKRQMNYGELGAINDNFNAGMAYKTSMDKLYQDAKTSAGGLALGMSSLSSHVTKQGENGDWGRFSGYNPSNVVDPIQGLMQGADEIDAKYDEEGQAFRTEETIFNNMMQKFSTNPDYLKAMQESYAVSSKKNEKGEPQDFNQFMEKSMRSVIQAKEYKKYNTVKESGKSQGFMPATIYDNFGMPNASGTFKTTGSDSNLFRSLLNKATGVDSMAEFNKSINTPEAKKQIQYMADKFNDPFPDTYYERTQWLEKHTNKPQVVSIVTRKATNDELEQRVNAKGMPTSTKGIYDQTGTVMSAEDIAKEWGSTETGEVARALGIVDAGATYPKGSTVIQGKTGRMMVQVPSDIATLSSPDYAAWQINKVTKTNTGQDNIDITVPIRNASGNVVLNEGAYTTVHNLKENTITMSQNGKVKYIVYPNDNNRIDPVN